MTVLIKLYLSSKQEFRKIDLPIKFIIYGMTKELSSDRFNWKSITQ